MPRTAGTARREVAVGGGPVELPGTLAVPEEAVGVVAFAHGSGSSRLSPRNRLVAALLERAGLATLLFDLLTPAEAEERRNVFDIPLLADRLEAATAWLDSEPSTRRLPVGYFGASTGAAAALWAAAEEHRVRAVVSRGGRPDLAASKLGRVRAPTLLVVGGRDVSVLQLNAEARRLLHCVCELRVVADASHVFEEPGALEAVGSLARDWFTAHLEEA